MSCAKALGALPQSWGRFPALARLKSPWRFFPGASPSLLNAFRTFQTHSRTPLGGLMAIIVLSRTIHLQSIMAKVRSCNLFLYAMHDTSKDLQTSIQRSHRYAFNNA